MGRNVKIPQSRATLEATAKQIEASAALLRAIGDQMEVEGFEVLKITHHDQLVRAMEYLDNFAAASRAALRRARQERGDFTAQNDVPESVAGRVGKSLLTAPKRTRISGRDNGKESK